MAVVLNVDSLHVTYDNEEILKNIHFRVNEGEILAIVGESGSGKSSILKAIMSLLGAGGDISCGTIVFKGKEIIHLSEKEKRKIYGKDITMIFQDTEASLCPTQKIGTQIRECMNAHQKKTKQETQKIALSIFEKLNLTPGKRILNSYPFELSGGMNQRVGIAMAMLHKPSLILADEPTSGLDMVAQKQVIEELLTIKNQQKTSIIMVTHNMGVAKAIADNILVLRKGEVVEFNNRIEIFQNPKHFYTKELLEAIPKLRSSIIWKQY